MYLRKYREKDFGPTLREYSVNPGTDFEEVKYASEHLYTDIVPYEILSENSNGTLLKIRRMKTSLEKAPSSTPGGFVAHFQNSEQRWICESDEKEKLIEISLRKTGWYSRVGLNAKDSRFTLDVSPVKFYDYNF